MNNPYGPPNDKRIRRLETLSKKYPPVSRDNGNKNMTSLDWKCNSCGQMNETGSIKCWKCGMFNSLEAAINQEAYEMLDANVEAGIVKYKKGIINLRKQVDDRRKNITSIDEWEEIAEMYMLLLSKWEDQFRDE